MGLIIKKAAKLKMDKFYDNFYFEKMLDTSNEWIVKRTGIEKRFFSERPLSQMAEEAAENLKLTDEEKKKIRLLIVSTVGGDFIVPSLAAILQGRLGLEKEVLAFDLNMACTGFVGGTILAESYLRAGEYVLVIGAEKLSNFTNFKDRTTAIIFADGAGACLYEKSKEKFYKDLGTISDEKFLTLKSDEGYLKMEGREVFRFATSVMPKSIEKVLKRADQKIDLFILHQANERIINFIEKKIPGNYYSNIKNYANTSSASIAMALADLYEKDSLRGKNILLAGFGGGLTYGTCIVRGENEIR
ncbi:beta-ketoacyl-ACP synthase 3 [uncultured Peptoniphilus sp.]|uniref:beta-ketoacyl-ACP synthase 3 n=1 Tax=uncultured Peptoniphilus sp. TaxID=254354 RepID=UPI002803FC55|nr:beta-ketoacyl-ACP synthase 3 [uncultured Peptoniphilus sp.]